MRNVTVDTGTLDDIFIGAAVIWCHIPCGGYGYTLSIDAKVVALTNKSVRIKIMTKAGEAVVRNVDSRNLRWRR